MSEEEDDDTGEYVARSFTLSATEGADVLALIIAEIIVGKKAPEHMSVDRALACLGDEEERFRRAGAVVHALIGQLVNIALNGDGRGKLDS